MTTMPRSTSSRFVPRSSRPTFSPARPSSSSLRNISTPVTVVVCFSGRMPTMSTVSLTLTTPRSIRPVTTVPRPVIVKTSSTGMRNGFSVSRTGSGIEVSTASISSSSFAPQSASPSSAFSAETRMTGTSSGELVLAEQLADLELDELEDLLVVDHVGLVQRNDDRRHTDLAGQEHVLLGLRHRAVGRGDHEDRAVHLRGTGDHVLDVVSVTRAVDVRVVPVLGLVLDVCDRDRDAARLLLGRLVDLVERRVRVECGHLVVQD